MDVTRSRGSDWETVFYWFLIGKSLAHGQANNHHFKKIKKKIKSPRFTEQTFLFSVTQSELMSL